MNMRVRLSVFALLALLLAACGKNASDDAANSDEPSAAVVTQPLRQGVLPENISAYGTAMPAVDAAVTLSVHAEGAVTRLDVAVGAPVRRGQHLLTFSLSPAAISAYRQARTAVGVARSQREHIAQLLQHRLATKDQLAQADKTWDDARSVLDALRRQQGDGTTMNLLAPTDGFIGTVNVAQGDLLQPGAPLLSLTRGNGVVVTVGVEADPQHPVKVGDTATLVPLGNGPSVQGVVKRVAGLLDPRTNLQNADITPEATVIVGMGYRADIRIGQWSGWLVPRDALVGDGTTWHVFQVVDGKAVEIPVSIVGESDTVTVVAGALDAKHPLVVVGNTQLENGMVVRATAQAEPSK
jgi:RND family efflux transporter MFP subunit